MVNWILTSSVLIASIIGIRALLGKRISMRLRYGLWLLVLARLLIPGNFIPSSFSVENMANSLMEQPQMQQLSQEWNTPQESYEAVYQEVLQQHHAEHHQTNSQPQTSETPTSLATLPPLELEQIRQEAELRMEQSAPIYSLRQVFTGLWILGMAVVGAFLLTANITFAGRLKRTRQPVDARTPVPVYRSYLAETPCLFGLVRPVIYITNEAAREERSLAYILAHESSHYRNRDHIWSFFRSLCLVLHWYNPLVWLAVSLSRQDCELACDEATIARIGEEKRLEYGKTLVDMTCIKRAPAAVLLTATTMLSDKKTLVHRIRQVTKQPRVLLSAIVAVIAVAAIAVGCTFTGAPEESTAPTEPSETTAPTEPTKTTEPSETTDPAESEEVSFGNWIYQPQLSAELTARSAVQKLKDTQNLSIADIVLLERKHIALKLLENMLLNGETDELGLTYKYLRDNFTNYIIYYYTESPGSKEHTWYVVDFYLLRREAEGPWEIWASSDPRVCSGPPDAPTEPDTPTEPDPTRWVFTPGKYEASVIREALLNKTKEYDGVTVDILSITLDRELTERNLRAFSETQYAKDLGLTQEVIEYSYRIYNVTASFTGSKTETYRIPFQMLRLADQGGWHVVDILAPEIVENPTAYEIRLARYRDLFDSSTQDGYIRQMALTSFYANVSLVDLSEMFYCDFSRGELTEAEKSFLTGKGFDLDMSVQSFTAEEIKYALKTAFGVSLQEISKTGYDKLTYWQDTDTYYTNHNDTNFPGITINRYEMTESDTIVLYYTGANMYVPGYEGQEFAVTIARNQDGSYRILSNSLPGTDGAVPVFPGPPEAADIKSLSGSPTLESLVKPYWEQGFAFVAHDTYYIAIPEVYPFSQEAIDCNREIYSLFEKALKKQIGSLVEYFGHDVRYFDISGADPSVGQSESGVFYYGYTASYQDGLLSIVVILDDPSSGRETYHTFNLAVPGEISTGALPSRETILTALEKEYKAMHANIDSSLDFYMENLKKTLSDENVDACILSYGEDGTAQITAWIYTFGSVDRVQKLIPLGG